MWLSHCTFYSLNWVQFICTFKDLICLNWNSFPMAIVRKIDKLNFWELIKKKFQIISTEKVQQYDFLAFVNCFLSYQSKVYCPNYFNLKQRILKVSCVLNDKKAERSYKMIFTGKTFSFLVLFYRHKYL